MLLVTKIFNRVIGVPFYQRNAGLFLFIFILMFGIVPGQQLLYYHLNLMYAMLGSWLFMSIVAGIWLLYGLKCFQFTMKTLSEPPNQFLYVTSNLPKKAQFNALFPAQVFIYLPVLMYSLIVAGVGFYDGQFIAATFVICFNSAICFISTILYRRKLNNPNPEKVFFLSKFFTIRYIKSYPLFFISQLVNEMKVIFVVTKFFSAIIIIAFLNGFFIDTYDSRVVMLGFMAGLTAHCVMVFEFRKFEESFLGFYRNLPVTSIKRLLKYAVVYALILLPEWIIFASAIPDRLYFSDAMWLPFFGTGILVLYHCLLYKPPLDMERYLQWVFGISTVLFFLILYKVYVLIIGILLLLSLFFFFRWYYCFEQAEEIT